MTREEAIKIIDCYDIGFYDLSGEKIPADKLADAFDMAIEALNNITDGEDLIINGAKGIKDGLYNIKDGKLFKYKANGGTVRTYPIVPSADAVAVVRCNDCIHWLQHEQFGFDKDNDEYHDYCALLVPVDDYYAYTRKADDLCSYGEKREEVNGFKSVGQAWNTSQGRWEP